MSSFPHKAHRADECESIHSLIPAYSVGATDLDEHLLVEAHLKHCPEAANELREYRELAEYMLESVPLRQPPAYLGDRLMESIRRSETAEKVPRPEPVVQPAAPVMMAENRKQRTMSGRVWAGALAAALALLFGSNLFWLNQVADLRASQDQIQAELEDHNEVLALVGTGAAQRIQLIAQHDDTSRAVLVCNPNESTGFIYAEDFPVLPDGAVYQVWLVQDQRRIKSGTFRVDTNGAGTLTFRASRHMGDFEAVEITREATPESEQPSDDLVVRGLITYGGEQPDI